MSANNDEENLNGLLEDALDDLLLSDTAPPKNAETKLEEVNKKPKDPPTTGGDSKEKQKSKVKKGKQNEAGTSTSNNSLPIDGMDGFDEEAMNKFFENMAAQLREELPKIDPEEAKVKLNESIPQIFDSIQNLISKEMLYPALKDFSPKFQDWLNKNKPKLSKAEQDRFEKQLAILGEIIEVFDDDSLGTQQKFEKNLELMETMHSYGTFPEELNQPLEIGKCSIM